MRKEQDIKRKGLMVNGGEGRRHNLLRARRTTARFYPTVTLILTAELKRFEKVS
jgi:hypothetical protein